VDDGSKIGLSRGIESANRADTLVYSFLFADRDAYDGVYAGLNGKKALQRIAGETGGSFLEVSRASQSRQSICSWKKSCATNIVSVTRRMERVPAIAKYDWRSSGPDCWWRHAMVTTRPGKKSGRNAPTWFPSAKALDANPPACSYLRLATQML